MISHIFNYDFSRNCWSIERWFEQTCEGDRHVNIFLFFFSSLFIHRMFSPDSVNFLPASFCAERIVQGVITNQKFLYIPKSYRLLEFVKRYETIFICFQ